VDTHHLLRIQWVSTLLLETLFVKSQIEIRTSQMKKPVFLALLLFTLIGFGAGKTQNDCSKDVRDARGKMKPWEKGGLGDRQIQERFSGSRI
jgi:hypothetical protein